MISVLSLDDFATGSIMDPATAKALDSILSSLSAEMIADVITHLSAKASVSKTRRTYKPLNGQNGSIRDWARKVGMPVGERGRLPQNIIRAYQMATSEDALTFVPASSTAKAPRYVLKNGKSYIVREDAAAARAFGIATGMKVAHTGRISFAVWNAYRASL